MEFNGIYTTILTILRIYIIIAILTPLQNNCQECEGRSPKA